MKYFFCFALILFFGCSSKIQNQFGEKEIEIVNPYAWINLMPGGSPKFFFTGELAVKNSFKEINVTSISIFQDDTLIKEFTSVFDLQNETSTPFVTKYRIGTREGLNPERINLEKNIVVEIHLVADSMKISKKISNLKIEKVY